MLQGVQQVEQLILVVVAAVAENNQIQVQVQQQIIQDQVEMVVQV
jgi:hypothetical protein